MESLSAVVCVWSSSVNTLEVQLFISFSWFHFYYSSVARLQNRGKQTGKETVGGG